MNNRESLALETNELQRPMTPLEERAMHHALRTQALSLLRQLTSLRQGASARQRHYLKEVGALLKEHRSAAARAALEPHFYDGITFPHGNPQRPLAEELLKSLRALAPLNPVVPLPEPWGGMSPGELMQGFADDPRTLRDLLLSTMDVQASPGENLRLVVSALYDNMQNNAVTPAFRSSAEASVRIDFRSQLRGVLLAWTRSFSNLTEDSSRALASLLRWRLERCENPLVLPQAWHIPHWSVNGNLSLATLRCQAQLQELLFSQSSTPLSAPLWDALVATLAHRCVLPGVGRVLNAGENSRLLGVINDLAARRGAIAEALLSLEGEDFAGLPPEMQRAFVERALGAGPSMPHDPESDNVTSRGHVEK